MPSTVSWRWPGSDRQRDGRRTLALLLPLGGNAWALCAGGSPNLTLAQEMREARFVVIARPQTFMHVQDLAEAPDGYVATRVRLKVDEVLYGKAPAEVTPLARNRATLRQVRGIAAGRR